MNLKRLIKHIDPRAVLNHQYEPGNLVITITFDLEPASRTVMYKKLVLLMISIFYTFTHFLEEPEHPTVFVNRDELVQRTVVGAKNVFKLLTKEEYSSFGLFAPSEICTISYNHAGGYMDRSFISISVAVDRESAQEILLLDIPFVRF